MEHLLCTEYKRNMKMGFVTHSTCKQSRVLILGNLPFVEPMRKIGGNTKKKKSLNSFHMYTIINMNKYLLEVQSNGSLICTTYLLTQSLLSSFCLPPPFSSMQKPGSNAIIPEGDNTGGGNRGK